MQTGHAAASQPNALTLHACPLGHWKSEHTFFWQDPSVEPWLVGAQTRPSLQGGGLGALSFIEPHKPFSSVLAPQAPTRALIAVSIPTLQTAVHISGYVVIPKQTLTPSPIA